MSKRKHLYLGKAGQFAVMSELLCRGWNVAVPEVDIGDDIFVVRDQNGEFIRVQVKTATSTQRGDNFSVQFNLPFHQLKREVTPELIYVFSVRHEQNGWAGHIVVHREILYEIYQQLEVELKSDNITLYFSFKLNQDIMCWNYNFKSFWNNFINFPMIAH